MMPRFFKDMPKNDSEKWVAVVLRTNPFNGGKEVLIGQLERNNKMNSYKFKETESFKFAVQVLGNSEVAEKWFMGKKLALNNKTPFELCKTNSGVKLVNNLLGRMEHGVFS